MPSVLLVLLQLSPHIVGPLVLIIAGSIVIRKGRREDNSVVWSIGAAITALGIAEGLKATIGTLSLILPSF